MDYLRPKNVEDALQMLKRYKSKAKLIAGGTNLLPEVRAKTLRSQAFVDISHIKNLSYIKEEKKRIRMGGLITISELASSNVLKKHAPILFDAANQLGNPLVRNRATIAGNLADASPAADTAVPLLALEATVITNRHGGKSRQIPIDQFFVGPNQTVLKNDEIIREILFSKPNSNTQMGYAKLGLRNAMAISVVSIAVLMERQKDECKKVRIALGAVAPKPIRTYQTEEMLGGEEVTKELIDSCCQEIEKEVHPITDIRASAEYRKSMASVLLKRLIQQLTK